LEELVEKNWCGHFESLLRAANDHDTREKVLISMLGMLSNCGKELIDNKSLVGLLNELSVEYKSLISNEAAAEVVEDDGYYKKIDGFIAQILSSVDLNRKQEL
jgi:hypothetical protein